MRSCHRPEQAVRASPTPSASSGIPHSIVPTSVSSPYNGISYNRVSVLMDVDHFRGSMNADGVSQNGYLQMLTVANPDPTSRSNSELSGTMPATRANTPPSDVTAASPYLPDLYFVASPEPSLSCVMALSYDILTSMLREDGIALQTGPSAPSLDRAGSPLPGVYSPSSLDESPVPAITPMVTWNTMPRELFLTPLGPGSDCRNPVNRHSCHSSRLTSTTGTSYASFASDVPSTLFASSLESLIDLVDRFNRQWARNGRPQSGRTSKGSAWMSGASSTASLRSGQLSWSWGLFLSVDTLPTMPLVLAAATAAQQRRLHRRLVRQALL